MFKKYPGGTDLRSPITEINRIPNTLCLVAEKNNVVALFLAVSLTPVFDCRWRQCSRYCHRTNRRASYPDRHHRCCCMCTQGPIKATERYVYLGRSPRHNGYRRGHISIRAYLL